ncbi:CvpA family protein [Candidatus Microgenomates bacterium]|nr:CvpA family protein [Candidatus Microgenomates bacterium]
MYLGLNWVDLVIIFILVAFALEGIGRPLILEILDFASFLTAFFISFSYYNLPSKFFEIQFQIPHGLSLVLGFVAMWFISEVIFYLLVRILFPKIPKLQFFGAQTLSAIPSFLRGLIFVALTLVLIATFPIQPLIKKEVSDSKLGSLILKNAYQLEQPVKQVFGGVSTDTLTFLTIKPQTDERINLGFQTTQLTFDPDSEQTMFDLLNNERVKVGLKRLVFDSKLQNIAREHSHDMLERGYFAHYSPEGENVADRATKAGIDFLVIGENLAYAPNVELAHKGLMSSEGHRANILSSDYGKIGIGVVDGGVYGKMFTQVFSN